MTEVLAAAIAAAIAVAAAVSLAVAMTVSLAVAIVVPVAFWLYTSPNSHSPSSSRQLQSLTTQPQSRAERGELV